MSRFYSCRRIFKDYTVGGWELKFFSGTEKNFRIGFGSADFVSIYDRIKQRDYAQALQNERCVFGSRTNCRPYSRGS
jgi:hypothetical protein